MRKRAENLFLSSTYSRAYKDVSKMYHKYIMEEALHYIESIGTFIFHGLLDEPILTIWKLFKSIVGQCMRYSYAFDFKVVNKRIIEFARLCEAHLPFVCTINLHSLLCRLP